MKTFKQFLEEANAPKPDAHKTIARNWQRRPGHKGLNLYITKSERDGKPNLRLRDVWVPHHLRGKGVGHRILKGLTKYADKTKQSVTLKPDPEKGYEKKLDKFYAGHGFKRDSQKGPDTHVRHPVER